MIWFSDKFVIKVTVTNDGRAFRYERAFKEHGFMFDHGKLVSADGKMYEADRKTVFPDDYIEGKTTMEHGEINQESFSFSEVPDPGIYTLQFYFLDMILEIPNITIDASDTTPDS